MESIQPSPALTGARAAARARSGGLSWRGAVGGLILLMWFVPMRLYRLPVNLPFNLEPYRLYLLILLAAVGVAALGGRLVPSAAGHGRSIALFVLASIASQFANWSTVQAASGGQALKSLSYLLSVFVAFILVASALRTRDDVEWVLRLLVAGGAIVGLAAVYEAHRHYDVFSHLQNWFPFLHYLGQGQLKFRGGNLRVRASAQDPIACGVVLAMVLPLGLYVASQARTKWRSALWYAGTLAAVGGALATVSRTVVLMLVVMFVTGLFLRKRAMLKKWPVLLVILAAVHTASPGAMSHLYKAFNPKQGLLSQQTTRAGQVGSGRLADLKPGIVFWSHSPLFGYGSGTGNAGTSASQVGRVLDAGGAPAIFDDMYLSQLISTGIVGFAAVVWFVWGGVIKLARRSRRGGPETDLLAACAIACAAFGASMATFDAFAFVQSTFMFCVILALGLRARALLPPATEPVRR